MLRRNILTRWKRYLWWGFSGVFVLDDFCCWEGLYQQGKGVEGLEFNVSTFSQKKLFVLKFSKRFFRSMKNMNSPPSFWIVIRCSLRESFCFEYRFRVGNFVWKGTYWLKVDCHNRFLLDGIYWVREYPSTKDYTNLSLVSFRYMKVIQGICRLYQKFTVKICYKSIWALLFLSSFNIFI